MLFATRSTRQEILGFSPAEHDVRGPLKTIKEDWMNAESEGTEVQRPSGKIPRIKQVRSTMSFQHPTGVGRPDFVTLKEYHAPKAVLNNIPVEEDYEDSPL